MEFNEIISKLPKPYYRDNQSDIVIYHADCRDILPLIPDKSIDLVLTDPPYPDQHLEYGDCDISFLREFDCRQLIFWSAKADFPLSYTAIHIWDKKCGVGSMYERIFERNGGKAYRVFRHYLINSTVAAKYTKDTFTGHPSQKPIALIEELVKRYSKENDVIFDPFMGSGTTLRASKELGRWCIGIEIEEKYCEIAAKRLSQSVMSLEV
jgi:DNA modification methylase